MWQWIDFFIEIIGACFSFLFSVTILDVSVAWIIMAAFCMGLLVKTLLFKP